MALTPTVGDSLGGALVVTNTVAPSIDTPLFGGLSIVNFPTPVVESSDVGALVAATYLAGDMQASFVGALVIARGRVFDPKVRAWTFTLDSHDYYVLHLGNTETLVYDTHSEQWYTWGSKEANLWRAFTGTNWQGGLKAGSAWSNVVVGDDGNGSLYFLDPNSTTDDSAVSGADDPQPFAREVQAQAALRGYGRVPCYSIELLGSVGEQVDSTFNSVSLLISDDKGHSYVDCGAIFVQPDDYDTRISWRSLGSMSYPGRLFKVKDRGALKRIDGFEMGSNS